MINCIKKIILLRRKQNILKQKLKENGFKWLKVPKKIIKKYRDTTNKNKDLDNFTIQYKLNREFYSSSKDSINEDRDICYYGYLKITKSNKTNTIINIHNSKSNRCGRIHDDVKKAITKIYESIFGGEL
jgi:hypothetical protein